MVAYSFKPRFVLPILQGIKTQTIRAVGLRRHASEGDALQLYTGMRTRHCKLITRAWCVARTDVRLDWTGEVPSVTAYGGQIRALDDFARQDGFTSIEDMRDFWAKEHPDDEVFEGVLIKWRRSHGPEADDAEVAPAAR